LQSNILGIGNDFIYFQVMSLSGSVGQWNRGCMFSLNRSLTCYGLDSWGVKLKAPDSISAARGKCASFGPRNSHATAMFCRPTSVDSNSIPERDTTYWNISATVTSRIRQRPRTLTFDDFICRRSNAFLAHVPAPRRKTDLRIMGSLVCPTTESNFIRLRR
jgi:hypothetical protein